MGDGEPDARFFGEVISCPFAYRHRLKFKKDRGGGGERDTASVSVSVWLETVQVVELFADAYCVRGSRGFCGLCVWLVWH